MMYKERSEVDWPQEEMEGKGVPVGVNLVAFWTRIAHAVIRCSHLEVNSNFCLEYRLVLW